MSDPTTPIVFVVCGAGGAGKGTIVSRLLEVEDGLWLSRSWTTRPQRVGEPDDAYVFASPTEFDARIESDGFYEWAQFFEYRYGTPTPDTPPDHDLVLEIDVQGAVSVRAREPDAVVVLVLPPTRAEQERRMRHRGDDDGHVAKRLAKSDAEEEIGHELADLIVVNNDLEQAVSEVQALVRRVREERRPG